MRYLLIYYMLMLPILAQGQNTGGQEYALEYNSEVAEPAVSEAPAFANDPTARVGLQGELRLTADAKRNRVWMHTRVAKEGRVSIIVTDPEGKRVYSLGPFMSQPGDRTLEIPTTGWPQGTYLVSVYWDAGGLSESLKSLLVR